MILCDTSKGCAWVSWAYRMALPWQDKLWCQHASLCAYFCIPQELKGSGCRVRVQGQRFEDTFGWKPIVTMRQPATCVYH